MNGECNESEEHKMVITRSQRQEEDSKGVREEGREARNKTIVNNGGVEMEEAASLYSHTQKRKPGDNQIHSAQIPSCIINVEGDGNCFFRCLSQALHRTQEKHSEVRADIVNTMRKDKAFYGPRIDGDFEVHLSNMSKDRTWATEAEIFAASELLNRDIFVYDQRLKSTKWQLHSRSGKCVHKRKYIAILLKSDHFSLMDVRKRPCICKNNKYHGRHVENREGMEESTQQGCDHDMSLDLDSLYGDESDNHISNPESTKKTKQSPSNYKTSEDVMKRDTFSDIYNKIIH